MTTSKITDEIAKLQRVYKSAPTSSLKKKIQIQINELKNELKASNTPVTKLAKQLLGSQNKVANYSNAEFKKVIKTLSKKDDYEFLKSWRGVGYSVGKVKDDLKRYAKPVGWRFKDKIVRGKRVENIKKPTAKEIVAGRKNGTVYFENRSNRSDVVRPVKLAEGGNIERGSAHIYITHLNGKVTVYHGDDAKLKSGARPLKTYNNVKEGTWVRIFDLLKKSQL